MQTTLVQIRAAQPSDLAVIVDFNWQLADETEGKTLHREQLTRGVAALLADPAKGRYFVAEVGGVIVGQLMHTYEWSDWRNGMLWWLQSVYVRPEFRGRGVFRALFEHVRTLAQSDPGVVGMRLYIDSRNAAARRVYVQCGLEPAGYDVLERMWTS